MATALSRIAAYFLRWPLIAAFARDPWLAGATLLLLVVAWVPLGATTFLPLVDYPNHLGLVAVGQNAVMGGMERAFYEVRWAPMPYWTGYVLILVTRVLFGVLLGSKVAVAIVVALVPLTLMRLLIALQRDPRLGLLGFALSWDFSLDFGWLPHCLGMSIAIFTLARLLEAERWRDALWCAPWTALVAVSHVLAVGVLASLAVTAAFTRRRPLRRLTLTAVGGSGAALVLTPWVLRSLAGDRPDGLQQPPWGFISPPPGDRIGRLVAYSTGSIVDAISVWAGPLLLLCCLLVPLLVSLYPQRAIEGDGDRAAAGMLGAALALYLLVPQYITGPVAHDATYPRFAVLVIMAWIAVPRPDLTGWRLAAISPFVLVCIYWHTRLFAQFRSFDLETRGLARVIEALPERPRVLPLTFDTRTPHARLPALGHAHGWVAAFRGGYDPYLFDYPTNPVGYRKSSRPPAPDPRAPHTLDPRRDLAGFDYVLVQARQQNVFRPSPQLELVLREGLWTLYKVRRPDQRG